MDQRTQNFIVELNKHLNKFYTINYACLKAGARGNQPMARNSSSFSGSAWLDDKMEILSNQRNQWISAINEAVLDLDSCGFNAAMVTFKQDFLGLFQEIYGPAGSFEDIIDGFKIKHPQFKKDFFNLDIMCKVSNGHPKYNLLCYNYLNYLNYYKQQISYEAYHDIFEALSSDLQPNGYKSFYFQRPTNGTLVLDHAEVEAMHEEALALKKRAAIPYKTALKKHNRSYKKIQKPGATQQAQAKFSHFRACFENAENQYAFVNELVLLTKMLSDRTKNANTPSNTTLANTLYENFFDLMSGVNIFDEKNNYHTDKVYVHPRELEYRSYLLSQIKTIQQYEVKKGEDKITQKEQ